MPLTIEIFSSPGCGKCGYAKQILEKMVKDMNADNIQWREVNILKELDYAVSLGVLSTPAIAIDGELVFSSLPSPKKLQQALLSRLEASGDRKAD